MSGRTGSGRSWWAGGISIPEGAQEVSSAYSGRHGREALDDYAEKLLEKSFNVRLIQEKGT
jgi:hypothetical protein